MRRVAQKNNTKLLKRKKSVFSFLKFVMKGFLVVISAAALSQATQSLGGVSLTTVTPRIVTPNGDLKNDVIFFNFDSSLSGLPIETAILDLHGAKVADMSFNSDETALVWDGKDDGGRQLPSGIYIYSIKIGKNQASGTVVVAR